MTRGIDARIVLGGKLQGFSGPYPCIVEEAWLAIKQGIPLYVIDGFDSAAHAVVQALEGKPPAALSLAFQQQGKQYSQLAEHYYQHFAPGSKHAIDYPALCEDLALCGVAGLDYGLNEEDNRRLMTTINIHEMIALVLKGLSAKFASS